VLANYDARATVGTLIGGRLDWVALGAAAKRLLPKLLAQPIPYPSIPGMPQPEPALPVRFLSALRAMAWSDQRVAIEWMEAPNPTLGGLTPAEKVKTAEGMAEVVAVLESMTSSKAEHQNELASQPNNQQPSIRRAPGGP
jgi:hypothetical protein